MDFPYKYGKHQTVFYPFMTVVRAKLSDRLHRTSPVICLDVYKPLRNHQRDPVCLLAQTVHGKLYHIKPLSEYLMAEGKIRYDFSDDADSVILDHFF